MKTYVCSDLYHLPNGTSVCTNWVEFEHQQHSFLSELASLSYGDITVILSMTAALFAAAWVWNFLSKQAYR